MRCVFAACTLAWLALSGLTLSGWAAGDEPLSPQELRASVNSIRDIIAHRGSSADRPENTLASAKRAVEAKATAIEIDIRTTSDGHLVLLHDAKLERTTNGSGDVGTKTLKEIRELDAGGKFDAYRGEKVPTLDEMLQFSEQYQIDLLLDLKESGEEYAEKIVAAIGRSGNAKRIIVGVRSTTQARTFRKLLPESRQLGFIPAPEDIESFAQVGVGMIRLWSKWLDDDTLVQRVRKAGAQLQINLEQGSIDELRPVLKHRPDAILCDDPALLRAAMGKLRD
ncbi:MAG: glycerophosphodiester phosphodiesterase family protein [Pirellulaceae bacterium]|nr:glycerophosphodiester phosphodiesterase family protein [Pirellulaceae bacterium]